MADRPALRCRNADLGRPASDRARQASPAGPMLRHRRCTPIRSVCPRCNRQYFQLADSSHAFPLPVDGKACRSSAKPVCKKGLFLQACILSMLRLLQGFACSKFMVDVEAQGIKILDSKAANEIFLSKFFPETSQ